jgi:hypothetical protein
VQDAILSLQQGLDGLRAGRVSVQAFSQQARGQGALLQALPDRYATVLLDLLDRLESSALFSEESCSFSQGGLLDNLQLWIDKAQGQLNKA